MGESFDYVNMVKRKPIEQLANDINQGDLAQFQTRDSNPHTGHYMKTSEDGKFLLFGFTAVSENPSFTVDKYKWHSGPDILLRYCNEEGHMDVSDYQILRRTKTSQVSKKI